MIPVALLGKFDPRKPCILFMDDLPSFISDFYDSIFTRSTLENKVNFLGVERAKWGIEILESRNPVKVILYRLSDNTVVQYADLCLTDIAVVISDISFGECRQLILNEVGVEYATESEDAIGEQGRIIYAGEKVCEKAFEVGIPALIITQQPENGIVASRIRKRGHAKGDISRTVGRRQESLDRLNRWCKTARTVRTGSSNIAILSAGFSFDVEEQLEKAGYAIGVAHVVEEALDDWRNEDYDLLLISPVLKGGYGDTEATKIASERLEQDAIQVFLGCRSRVLRIPPGLEENIEYILSEVQLSLSQE